MAVLGSLLLACKPPSVDPTAAAPDRAAAARPTTEEHVLPIELPSARYGLIAIRTGPGAECTLRIDVDPGRFGDGPPTTLSGTADVNGSLAWAYPAPLVPSGRGRHLVRCRDGTRSGEVAAEFPITAAALGPRRVTVSIRAVELGREMPGVEARSDPSLVPTRDAAAAKLEVTLETAWSAATRGLGSVRVVASSADVPIYVMAGRGHVEHHTADDGTRRIVMPLVDDGGPLWPSVVLTAALHELGHIWCCYGADAGADGHWLEEVADPRLTGVNRFGLMNRGLHCQRFIDGTSRRCPDRFSERELHAMGFGEIPAPPADPCVAERRALEERIDALDAALDAVAADIADRREELSRSSPPAEAQRTRLVTPDDPRRTRVPGARYDVLRAELAAMTAAYNRQVDARNAVSAQLRALPPC